MLRISRPCCLPSPTYGMDLLVAPTDRQRTSAFRVSSTRRHHHRRALQRRRTPSRTSSFLGRSKCMISSIHPPAMRPKVFGQQIYRELRAQVHLDSPLTRVRCRRQAESRPVEEYSQVRRFPRTIRPTVVQARVSLRVESRVSRVSTCRMLPSMRRSLHFSLILAKPTITTHQRTSNAILSISPPYLPTFDHRTAFLSMALCPIAQLPDPPIHQHPRKPTVRRPLTPPSAI